MNSAKIVKICNAIAKQAIALEQTAKSKSIENISHTMHGFSLMLADVQNLNIFAARNLIEYTHSIIGENIKEKEKEA